MTPDVVLVVLSPLLWGPVAIVSAVVVVVGRRRRRVWSLDFLLLSVLYRHVVYSIRRLRTSFGLRRSDES